MNKISLIAKVLLAGMLAGGGIYVWQKAGKNKTIEQLLGENKELKQAITNLSEETQIGYAKVTGQQMLDGVLYTKLIFVETDRNDPTRRLLEKEYEIEGDVVYFDAMIVKFDNLVVMDGTERAMYLWRRVYGEKMRPEEGFPIETPGVQAQRYADLCQRLSIKDRKFFWEEIWALSNDAGRLAHAGVKAIYGNVVYRKLKPGLIYVFKISSTGSLSSETVPDL